MTEQEKFLTWNPWHGCRKYSEGCQNCYVYRIDRSFGKDASVVTKTSSFNMALLKKRDKSYRLPSGSTVFTCMSSDFFIEEADPYRDEVWGMINKRKDVRFNIITKRISRFLDCIPNDWGVGYENVTIGCTIENQPQCDARLPIFLSLPINNRFIICEPLLGPIVFKPRLNDKISYVIVGGESGQKARVCDYDWVLAIREQCIDSKVSFHFKQTGENFKKDNVLYRIKRSVHNEQAKKAGIDIEFLTDKGTNRQGDRDLSGLSVKNLSENIDLSE